VYRLRLSLSAAMGIIAVIALGLAGMMAASRFWTTAAATVSLALLLGSLLSAFMSEGTDRAFSAGFALFGWTYLLLVNWDWIGGQFGHDLTAGLSEIADMLFPEPTPPVPTQVQYFNQISYRQTRIGNFVQISRLLLSLLFALLGGFIAMALVKRRESRKGDHAA
jgi:uncharacterized membrane protein YeaQ/YmgE (transglycosylase-associated protein family)